MAHSAHFGLHPGTGPQTGHRGHLGPNSSAVNGGWGEEDTEVQTTPSLEGWWGDTCPLLGTSSAALHPALSRTLFCSCSCGALSWSEPTDARTSPSSGWPCSPACILGWSPRHPSDLLTSPLPCPTFCSLSALQPRFFPPHSQAPQSQEIPRELAEIQGHSVTSSRL